MADSEEDYQGKKSRYHKNHKVRADRMEDIRDFQQFELWPANW